MSNEITKQANSLSIIESVDIGAVQSTLTKINQFQAVVQNTLRRITTTE